MNLKIIGGEVVIAITIVILSLVPAIYASRLNCIKPKKMEPGTSLTFFPSRPLLYIPTAVLFAFSAFFANARIFHPNISQGGADLAHGFALLSACLPIGMLIGLRFVSVYVDNDVVEYRRWRWIKRITRSEITAAYAANGVIIIIYNLNKRFAIPLCFAGNGELLSILKYTSQFEKNEPTRQPIK